LNKLFIASYTRGCLEIMRVDNTRLALGLEADAGIGS
jgi:hypothetical protein